jgi:hypothetical protein
VKDILDGVSVIGIIGLAKNAGKTTTLNKIIEIYPNMRIGLTSIGLDGEPLDQIYFFPKPAIMVRPNMVVATTLSCLESSDVMWKLIEKTDYHTPLGEILIVEIVSEGTVIVAGPSTNQELNQVVKLMKKRCDKILIDGAFNRLTFSNIDVMEGIVLAAGASYHPDMEVTLKKTSDLIRLFGAKKTEFTIDQDAGMMIYHQYEVTSCQDKKIQTLESILKDSKTDIIAIYIKGAITSAILDCILNYNLKSITLIMDDPSKWMASQRHLRALSHQHMTIEVIKTFPIIMVTINPFRPDGAHYDELIMMNRFKSELDVPIFNVKGSD